MAYRGGRWRGRPSLSQIEELAFQKIEEFQAKLKEAGLTVPTIPPVPAEYIALTITELSVRGVPDLLYNGKNLSGLLDIERGEILYNEKEPAGRQIFSIAHELGHYFLHYLPALELARQPTLFNLDDTAESPAEEADRPLAHYFRCQEVAITPPSLSEDTETEVENPENTPKVIEFAPRLTRKQLEDPKSKAQLARLLRAKELNDRMEWEANLFAGSLVMPADLMRWLNRKLAGDIDAMADELAMTTTAVRYRMNNLRLRNDENKGLPLPENARPQTHVQGTFF